MQQLLFSLISVALLTCLQISVSVQSFSLCYFHSFVQISNLRTILLQHDVEEVQQLVQGACFDTEYAGK